LKEYCNLESKNFMINRELNDSLHILLKKISIKEKLHIVNSENFISRDNLDFENLCNMHEMIFRTPFLDNEERFLNISHDCESFFERQIYNNFFTDRGHHIFIKGYEDIDTIKLVIKKIISDLGDFEQLKNIDDTALKLDLLSKFALKLYQANVFNYGNEEVIFVALSFISEKIILPLNGFYKEFEKSYFTFKSILSDNTVDRDVFVVMQKQLRAFLETCV